ncbi:MAG: hypothetical protein DWQ34_14285 [Planctomycetota bacterium]|nr:MAG: hypothetical protein DWQ34_14285 [Planctomycetota bacterium]REK20021.1 MAG: hypothetical protein DWQ41_27270 [Planctomycetota bacterium]REK27588.1 MAG: hypothetical protein DWQ45_26290 [Planctomycetota bacterium]
MNAAASIRTATTAMLAVGIAYSLCERPVQAQGVTLDEIRERLDAWEAEIPQFRVVWEIRWDPYSKLAREAGTEGAEGVMRVEWDADEHGWD